MHFGIIDTIINAPEQDTYPHESIPYISFIDCFLIISFLCLSDFPTPLNFSIAKIIMTRTHRNEIFYQDEWFSLLSFFELFGHFIFFDFLDCFWIWTFLNF